MNENAPASPSCSQPPSPQPHPSHDVKVHVLAPPLQRDVVAHAPLVQNKLAQLLSPAMARGSWLELSLPAREQTLLLHQLLGATLT